MSPWPRPVSPIGHGEWRRVAKLSVTVSAIHPRFPPTAPPGSPTRPPGPPYRPEVARPSCTPRADPLGPVRADSGEKRADFRAYLSGDLEKRIPPSVVSRARLIVEAPPLRDKAPEATPPPTL